MRALALAAPDSKLAVSGSAAAIVSLPAVSARPAAPMTGDSQSSGLRITGVSGERAADATLLLCTVLRVEIGDGSRSVDQPACCVAPRGVGVV